MMKNEKNMMKKEGRNESTGTIVFKKKIVALGMFLNKNMFAIGCALALSVMVSSIAYADDAETLWTTISTLLETWVTRLGGVVMFVGGIMFGLGWKDNDAEAKTRGISTIIAGGIVVAVAALTSTFFA